MTLNFDCSLVILKLDALGKNRVRRTKEQSKHGLLLPLFLTRTYNLY